MVSKMTKIVRSVAAASVVAGAFTVFGPAGVSSAINEIQCNPDENFSKIYSHDDGGDHVNCYANAGKMQFNAWVDKVEAGNNKLFLYDRNGDVIAVEKWQTLDRSTPADIESIEIK